MTLDPHTIRIQRAELILRQLEALPTLPAIATKLLSLTANTETHIKEITNLIEADPALTLKILALSRKSNLGIREDILTIERAVILLGFNAVRNSVLSMKILDVFESSDDLASKEAPKKSQEKDPLKLPTEQDLLDHHFDRNDFWRHSLAVALTAEFIVAHNRQQLKEVDPGDAYVCGLLHDIGKLALDYILPKSYIKVIQLAEINQGNIAEFEHQIIGLDHHTAGKRLAEQWNLPHRLQDAIWLHGSPSGSLPQINHQQTIAVIRLADNIAREAHIGFSGNYHFRESTTLLAKKLRLDLKSIDEIKEKIFPLVETRSQMLGLDQIPSKHLMFKSLQRANQALGQLNQAMERRNDAANLQHTILERVAAFHASAMPGQSVQNLVTHVAIDAMEILQLSTCQMIYQPQSDSPTRPWILCHYRNDGQLLDSQLLDKPSYIPDLHHLSPQHSTSMSLTNILAWLSDTLGEKNNLDHARLLPLSCGWGVAALLVHTCEKLPLWQTFSALTGTWGAAIAAANQHEGAKRLSENLAEANLALAEIQCRLSHTESMARLGEMAAGAAHEMNNPLAVISGRSQLLAKTLPKDTKQWHAAITIDQQANRLSNLITLLKLFAEPPSPDLQKTNLTSLLEEAIDDAKNRLSEVSTNLPIHLSVEPQIPEIEIDPEQIRQAITELVCNAIDAHPKTGIQVVGAFDQVSKNKLQIKVIDDGQGMDQHTLLHAMDPFFSAKSAGRQVGMGLARAQQLVVSHGGKIGLQSILAEGTTAFLVLPLIPSNEIADLSNKKKRNDQTQDVWSF